MRRFLLSLLSLLLFSAQILLAAPSSSAAAATGPAQVTGARWAVHTDAVSGVKTLRLVMDVTGPVKADSAIVTAGDPRLVVTLNGAATQGKVTPLKLDGQIASAAAFSTTDANTRLVIDLPALVDDNDYRVFSLPQDPKNNKPYRVVVDINQPTPPISYNFSPGLKGKVIVLDPGHGGSDSGAIGLNKTQEKQITLAIAQDARALLEKAGAKVIMTRQDDTDVYGPNATAVQELSARVNVGNNNKADIFLSVHINSFTDRSANGSATYYYKKSAYDVLLAQSLQTSLVQADGLLDRGISSANFYVIKRTTMPAALMEVAFISNPNEEKLMNTDQFQQRTAQSIVEGLDRFFTQASQLGGGR